MRNKLRPRKPKTPTPVMISIFKTRIYRGWDEPAPDVDLHLEVTY